MRQWYQKPYHYGGPMKGDVNRSYVRWDDIRGEHVARVGVDAFEAAKKKLLNELLGQGSADEPRADPTHG
jgi:O-succinylbenzoate synthase